MCALPQDVDWWQYDEARAKTGMLCFDCGHTWEIAYKYLSLSEFCTKLLGEDGFKESFRTAAAVLKGSGVRRCDAAEVAEEVEVGYELRRTMLCFTKTGYKQRYGVFPDQVGHKPVELLDEHGDAWTAFLVLPPEEDDVRELSLVCRKTVGCTTFAQMATETLYASQASSSFRHLSAEPKSQMLRKVAKALPQQVIESKAADLGVVCGAPLTGVSLKSEMRAAALGGQPEGPSEASSPRGLSTDHSVVSGTPLLSLQGSAASIASLTRTNSEKGSDAGEVRSLWAGTESGLGGSASKGGPARSADEHIARLCVSSVLAGCKPGREKRWAEKYAEDHGGDPDIGLLKAHLRAIDAAVALQLKGSSRVSDTALEMHLTTLDKAGVDFPSEVKLDLVDRAVESWHKDPKKYERVHVLLQTIEPWLDEGDDKRLFVPKEPRLSATDGSPGDRLEYFRNALVKRVLIPLINGGQKSAKATETVCISALKRFQSIEEIPDDYGEALGEMFVVFRVVLTLLKGDFAQGASQGDFDRLSAALVQRTSRNLLSVVANVLDQNDWYKSQEEAFTRFAVPTREHRPAIDEALMSLAADGETTTVQRIIEHMRLIERVSGKVRQSVLEPFEQWVEDTLRNIVHRTQNQLQKGQGLSDNHDDFTSMLNLAVKLFGVDAERTILAGDGQ